MFRGVSFRRLGKLALRPSGSDLAKKCLPLIFARAQTKQLFINSQSWANFSTTQVTQASNTEILATSPNVEEILRRLDTAEWTDVLQTLEKVGSQFPGAFTFEEVEIVYNKIEEIFLQGHKDSLKTRSVVELGYAFGKLHLGSEAFWNKLVQRFSTIFSTTGLNTYDAARFLFGASNRITFEMSFFQTLENGIVESNETLTPEVIAYLLPTLAKVYAANQQRGLFDKISFTAEQENDFTHYEIQDAPLWGRLTDAAMEALPQMDSTDLSCVLDAFVFSQYKDDGIWTPIEQRFNQLKSQLTISDYANYAYYFGTLQRGSSEFWAHIEQLCLEEVKDLSPQDLKSFVLGLARSEEGSLKLWHLIEQRIMNSDLSTGELAAYVECFSANPLASVEFWNRIEKQIVTKINEFDFAELVELVKGLGRASSGFQSFWTAVETRLLEGELKATQDLELLMYLELKSSNKLTPELTRHFRHIAEQGDQIFESLSQSQESEHN